MTLSLIIPAHNEENVLARLLTRFGDAGAGRDFEVIVVCNACTDRTASVAREALPRANVLETDIASKALALNLGNQQASGDIRFYADADLDIGPEALLAVAQAMAQSGHPIAAPRMEIALGEASRAVRRYYKVWQLLPYHTENMVGPALYALSAQGRERVGALPAIIADDEYVRRCFTSSERLLVTQDSAGQPVSFRVYTPLDLASLIRTKARQHAGVKQLERQFPRPADSTPSSMRSLAKLVLGGTLSGLDAATYLGVKLAARGLNLWNRLHGRSGVWLRDESARNTIGTISGPRTK